ncbi:MAG: hypothetical protein P4N41_10505 [Negativicutes bacterium]|nr:hypothetical protein [Negativicutes bacterium]
MPVLTFMHDLFSFARGSYERIVGRHTRRFCSRAAQKAKNDAQKRLLLVAAVCADELLAAIFGVSEKSRGSGLSAAVPAGADKTKVREAMRIYLSALLIRLGSGKTLLLEKTGVGEEDFLRLWCQVFEYQPADMLHFDQELGPAYQSNGEAELAAAAAGLICSQLFGSVDGIETAWLQERLADDAAAMIRVLETLGGRDELCSPSTGKPVNTSRKGPGR